MNKTQTINQIQVVFANYKATRSSDRILLQALSTGKLYELYVLSELVVDLKQRGCHLSFVGQTLAFKGAPGKINNSDPHFRVTAPNGSKSRLFVDIEFVTMGRNLSRNNSSPDLSARHELDLALVETNQPYPFHSQVLLAVECKAVSNFQKKIVREVLGIRRELSLFTGGTPSLLIQAGGRPQIRVPAMPASEFWLAFIDPSASSYRLSPLRFGIEFKHLPLP